MEHLSPSSKTRRKLSVCVLPLKHASQLDTVTFPDEYTIIEDINEFRSKAELFPNADNAKDSKAPLT